jgi:sugar-specific transcriptional regulator TrmB
MPAIDLTPFGFTRTESTVYAALLRTGAATGYALARATGLARANVYAALEGLAARGAATRVAGQPTRFRPAEPAALLARLAADQAAVLERLERSFQALGPPRAPVIQEVVGARPLATTVLQLVARAETTVAGTIGSELWRAVIPGLRRAAARARVTVRTPGGSSAADGVTAEVAPADAPTILLIDDSVAVLATGSGDGATGVWSTHGALIAAARTALASY